MKKKIIIGTRGSKLALWQAEWVKNEIEKKYPGTTVSLQKIKTEGDKIQDVALSMVGGKGLFVKEIEEALIRKEIDLAVHSMKDVPAELPVELHISAITKREDPSDVLISKDKKLLRELPEGSKVGTSSLRRQSQLLNFRPDLKIIQLRGNVDTRIRKLEAGEFDAIVLASAGIKRLGFTHLVAECISKEISLPAIGQGALGIETRKNDTVVNEMVLFLNDEDTSYSVKSERAFLKRLEGGCQVPVAGFGEINNGILRLFGIIGEIDGSKLVKGYVEGKPKDGEEMGVYLAELLLGQGGDEILKRIYGR